VRAVSRELSVGVNTVFRAFAILEAKGMIISRPRSGYIVNAFLSSINRTRTGNDELALPKEVETTAMGAAMMKNAKEKGIVNLSILAPVNEVLPIAKLNKAVVQSLYEMKNNNIQYPLVEGHPRLLKQIARRTFDWQKSVHQSQILVTNGCMEAINLCLDVVTKAGNIVVVESPTNHGILQSIEKRKLRVLEIKMDPKSGLDLNDLREAITANEVAACVLMPRCHNPTGISMPEASKMELVDILGRAGIPLIEDDALGELNFHNQNSFPAKAYDTFDNVLYCSSFSKTLAPGFRIGWVCAGKYHEALERIKFGSNISTNGVLQDAIGRYLESGLFEKHLRKMRLTMQIQLVKYLNSIAKNFPPDTNITVPQGGLSIWIELPANKDAYDLQKQALAKGIGICPGHTFSTFEYFHHYIRINLGPIFNYKIEKPLSKLGQLLH
jgi:DNA-binding transcriptional MocR family regulator